MKKSLKEVFKTDKPVIAVIHLSGFTLAERCERMREEIEICYRNGLAILVMDYFGTVGQAEKVLELLQNEYSDAVYGINVLGHPVQSYDLARRYGCLFVQADSVSGDLPPREDEECYGEELQKLRKENSDIFLLGGVRFKGFLVSSGRSLEEDILVGRERCDAVVVTGEGTGLETKLERIMEFRKVLGDFPLIIGAGVTAENVREQLNIADGAIVGTYFKNDDEIYNLMNEDRVVKLLNHLNDVEDKYNLQRYLNAQEGYCGYQEALIELQQGNKNSCWVWYIFPSVEWGNNDMISDLYAIKSLNETTAYFEHDILGKRLRTCCYELLSHDLKMENKKAEDILGGDAVKVRSSMTLFSEVLPDVSIFEEVLTKYFGGKKCEDTLEKIRKWREQKGGSE